MADFRIFCFMKHRKLHIQNFFQKYFEIEGRSILKKVLKKVLSVNN